MTDTDSRSLEFMINAEDCCDVGEREMRDIVIKVYLDNDIHHRLDLSGEFFEQFVTRRFKNKWDCTNLRTLSRVSSAQYVLTQRNTLTYMEYTMRLTRSIKVFVRVPKAWISTIMLDVSLLLTKLTTVQNVLLKNKNKPDFKAKKGTWLWLPSKNSNLHS